MSNRDKPAVVDVHVDDALKWVLLTARSGVEVQSLVGAVREVLPSPPRRSAQGVRVPAELSHWLLELDGSSTVRLVWTEFGRRFVENRARTRLRVGHQRDAVRRLLERDDVALHAVGESRGHTALDGHQVVNVAAMTVTEGFGLCLFDEQGAGKTVSCIYAFDLLVERDEADRALIIAPKSMVPEWKEDVHRFMGDLYRVQMVTGTRSEKRRALSAAADLLVTNYETAVTLEREFVALLRREGQRFILIVDESFNVKNLDARRTRSIRRLREYVGRAFVLSGTPAPNTPEDVVQQFNIVDFGVTFDGFQIPSDPDSARTAISQRIHEQGLFVRHLKRDVLPQLPQKRFHTLKLGLEPVQARLYESALKEYADDLGRVSDDEFNRQLTTFLARRSALIQICSHPGAVVRRYKEDPAKLLALDELLSNLIDDQGEKVVVWSYYTYSLESIFQRYGAYRPVRYDGSVTDIEERRDSVRRFQEDKETMLFVGNPAAAGAGLTLHRARVAVYESLSNQGAHYLQSIDRIHRRGQDREVEYFVLLCGDTIEEDEYNRLLAKERSAQLLLGDPEPDQWSREVLMAEAIKSLERLSQGAV